MTGLPGGPPLTGGAGAAPDLIRHEQRLRLSTTWIATETVRVRRRIVTETRMVPVEVRTEVLDVEHLPQNDFTTTREATAGPDPTPDLILVLHEEVPVVTVRSRATERVTVSVRTVTSQVEVSEQLQSEKIDVTTVPATPAR